MSSTTPTTSTDINSNTNPNNSRFLTVPKTTSTSPPPVRLNNPNLAQPPATATGYIIKPTRAPSQGGQNLTAPQPRPIVPMILTTPGQVQSQRRDNGNHRENNCYDDCCENIRAFCNYCCVLGPPLPRDPRLIRQD